MSTYNYSPFVVTTAQTISGRYSVKYLEWHPHDADDDLLVKDGLDNILWQIRAPIGAPNSEAYGILTKELNTEKLKDIVIETIDGGTLYIYLK